MPPGMDRLLRPGGELEVEQLDRIAREIFLGWVSEAMTEAAEEGAILIEMRFGAGWAAWPDLMPQLREAERLT